MIVTKVMAYITNGDRLLVFREVDHPQAGIQVPAGTVESGEELDVAVLREAWEESGLQDLQIVRYLGVQDVDLSSYGDVYSEPGIARRHFYHLEHGGESPERWRHWENNPSEGHIPSIEFELYWVDFPDQVPTLSGDQGEFLQQLQPCP